MNWRPLLLILFLLITVTIRSQNLYDYDHSLKYAGFLINSKKYQLASEEYERIIFLNDGNDSIKHLLLKSYILNGDFSRAVLRTNELFSNNLNVPREIALDYTYALMLSGMIQESEIYTSQSQALTTDDRIFFKINRQLISNQWDEAYTSYSVNPVDRIPASIFNEINNAKFKSSPLAVALSAVIPGSGKVYSGDWKDGIISFVFIAGFTVQAIRGYNNYGERSAHFIGYSSLAGAFYLSNLYGTYKSVRKHNESAKQKIHNRIKSTFFATY